MPEYDVALVECADYAECEKALRSLFDITGWLDWVRPDMKIVIKANLVTAMKPESAATTHPALVSALSGMLVERGAKVIIGDSPGGIYNSAYLNRVYTVTGMRQAESPGAELNQNFGQEEVTFPAGKVMHRFTCTSYLLDCDAIIDFCKLKSHGMMGMSGAAKNMFGAIPGMMKPEYHFKYPDYSDFADMIVDLDEYFKPRLCIADAVVGMEGNGPTSGTPRQIGMLAASPSPHKLDLVCATVIGIDKEKIPTLLAACSRGLVPEEAADLKIYGSLEQFMIKDYKSVAVPSSLLFAGNGKNLFMRAVSAAAGKLLRSSPKLTQAECIGCGVCVGMCPAKAIEIIDKKASINKRKCIRCFCCQEFCPKGAMKVKRTAAARILSKI